MGIQSTDHTKVQSLRIIKNKNPEMDRTRYHEQLSMVLSSFPLLENHQISKRHKGVNRFHVVLYQKEYQQSGSLELSERMVPEYSVRLVCQGEVRRGAEV